MAASKVQALERVAYGYALDLLDAISEVETVDSVTVNVHDSHGIPSVRYTAWDAGRRVFDHLLVGGEVSAGKA